MTVALPITSITAALMALLLVPLRVDLRGVGVGQNQGVACAGYRLVATVAQQMRARVRVLVAGDDDCATTARRFVDPPTGLVGFSTDLHLSHVLVPAADAPDCVGSGQLVRG